MNYIINRLTLLRIHTKMLQQQQIFKFKSSVQEDVATAVIPTFTDCFIIWREFIQTNAIGNNLKTKHEFQWTFSVPEPITTIAVAKAQWSYNISKNEDIFAAANISFKQFVLFMETAQYWYKDIHIKLRYEVYSQMGKAELIIHFELV